MPTKSPAMSSDKASKKKRANKSDRKDKGKGKRKAKGGKLPMAATADRHDLYQQAVQCVESEIDFVDDTYKAIRGRRASFLREDFCGTANTSCEWVRRRKTNYAVGVDLDKPTLDWGQQNNIARLKDGGADRVKLFNENVLTVQTDKPDIILAMNFSYFIFEQRDLLRSYFKAAREALDDDGIMFLDCYGGYESFKVMKEDREVDDDVTYVWEQADYNPIDGHMVCHITFKFADGSKMRRAFTYEWRLWTLPEIRELLNEAGFSKVTVYWEGTDEDTGEGDGEFEAATKADPDPAWVAYIAAEK